MNVVVNGLMTNYLKTGSGKKVIICLHGWGEDATTFSKLTEKFKDGFTFLAPDLPGFGGTEEPPKPWGVDDYANFITAWLKKIGKTEVFAIVGYSNGGAIAISLLGNQHLKVKKLILIASSGIRDIYRMKRLILRGSAKIAKLPLKLLPKNTQNRIKRKAYAAIGSDYMLLPELDLSYRRMISQDMQATATHINAPTLLIYGREDDSTPVKYGQLFKDAIPNSRLEVIENGGHFIHQEQAKKIAGLVENFLR